MALNRLEHWQRLGRAALTGLDIDMAIRIYRHMGDAGMVMALNSIRHIEDRNLLAGYVAMYLENFNMAQDLFLASSSPKAALEVRNGRKSWWDERKVKGEERA